MLNRRLLCVLLLLVGVAACGQSSPRISLEKLSDEQKFRDGETVVVEGQVAMAEEPLHYWIEDGDFHRVGLRPEDAVTDQVGEEVKVRGTFSYSPERGRWIRVEEISRTADVQ